MRSRLHRLLVVITGGVLAAAAVPSLGAVTVAFSQVGSDVVATGWGSANLAALTLINPNVTASVAVFANAGSVALGSSTRTNYSGISGPGSFGPGGLVTANSWSGDPVGVIPGASIVVLPRNYVSGSPLSGSATWNNHTFASLGLADGTYVWSWGSGPTADTFTIIIPGPGAAAMALPAGLLALRRRRR